MSQPEGKKFHILCYFWNKSAVSEVPSSRARAKHSCICLTGKGGRGGRTISPVKNEFISILITPIEPLNI